LNQFKAALNNSELGYGDNHPEAKNQAIELHRALLQRLAECDPKSATKKDLIDFNKFATELVKNALPILEKDLGLAEYVLNMLKAIANIVTCGAFKTFFAPVSSGLAMEAQKLQNLQDNQTAEVNP
jgi:hypothetical protein